MNSPSAFVSSFAPASLTRTTFTTLTPRRPSTSISTTTKMVQAPKKRTPSTDPAEWRADLDRRARMESEYRGPQGFTPYAEKVNGRVAQMGFLIGFVTEIVSGKTMPEQMFIMFSPFTHLVQALVGTITG